MTYSTVYRLLCVQVGGLLADDSATDFVPGLEPCGVEEPTTDPMDLGCFRDSRTDRRLVPGLLNDLRMTPDVSCSFLFC